MSEHEHTRDAIANLPYALFALQQSVTLEELHPAADRIAMRAAKPQSPEWFAAAASDEASLLETAPELLAANTNAATTVVSPDSDIIEIYAPGSVRPSRSMPAVEEEDAGDAPRASKAFELLQELTTLDP